MELRETGERLLGQGRFDAAANAFAAAVEQSPDDAVSLVGLATALSMTGELGRSIELCGQAISLDPGYIRAYGILGGVFQRLGRFEEAISCARSAIALRPGISKPYVEIVRCKRIGPEDAGLVSTLEGMLGESSRPTPEKFHIAWALGKGYDDLGQFDRALDRFDMANGIAREIMGGVLPYDLKTREAEVETIRTTFAGSLSAETDDPPMRPLLIVGMIRSGTTLLDTQLCRYEGIASVGELRFWEEQTTRFFRSGLSLGSEREIRALGGEYRSMLARVDPAAKFVIDKMPMNHRFLGFVLRVVPEAKIIHLRRHPFDTCVSVYTTDFGPRPPQFAFDRSRIVHAYKMYQRLMEHWRSVVPEASMIEVDYEKLVGDTDATLGGILRFLGLPARSQEGNGDDVRTPSRWQARQPVYSSSVGRWRNYKPWLKEFGVLSPHEQV